ncbi:hypothetical protein WAI453_006729 [Rhynchosporium graminicola]
MPHVINQWQSDHLIEDMDFRGSTKLEKATSTEFLRPVQISIRRSRRTGIRPTPSLKLLATRDHEHSEYGSSLYDSEQLAWEKVGGGRTPSSSVESVFEMYTSNAYSSPNSSTHSSFIAELEDTALVKRYSRLSAPPESNKMVNISPSDMEFQTSDLGARAVIKVVDETIASIEDSNRKLLSRAVAAEDVAKSLREQNSRLQLKIERCTRKTRPRTAPSSPVSKTGPNCIQKANDQTTLSLFHATIDELTATARPNTNRSQSEPNRVLPPYPAEDSSLWPQAPLSAPFQSGSISSPNHHSFPAQRRGLQPPTYHCRPPSLPAAPRPHHFESRPQPQPEIQIQPQSRALLQPPTQTETSLLSPFSSPGFQPPTCPPPRLKHRELPIYNTYHSLTPAGTTAHLRTVHLHPESQLKDKPLPPLGPMSPSVLSGLVEIGTNNEIDEWGREAKRYGAGRRKRGLSDLFKKAKDNTVWR